jgi:transposase/DUF971 family protein
MIDYQTYCAIREARDREGLSGRQIAQRLGLRPETVNKWLERERYEPRQGPARKSKLDTHKGTIVRLLEKHPYTAAQLLVRLREAGYDGGYSILKEFIRTVRPEPAAFLTLQFAPGQCAQVDWGSWGSVQVGDTRRQLSFFAMVLAWSRMLYVEFTLGQSQEQFLSCHEHAFASLHGVPGEVWVDNCKTAVLSHPSGGPVVFNPRYLDFARHCGFTIKACGPHHPQGKGRVESAVGYVKGNFLAGLDPKQFAPINPAARLWLDTVANVRVHGEAKRRPLDLWAEERPKLRPLPVPYDCATVRPVHATNRWRVAVEGNRYSVPPRYASSTLTLKLYAERLRLFAAEVLVAEHPRSYERGRDFEHPDHARELVAQRGRVRHQGLLLAFLRLSPQAQAYHDHLAERRLNVGHHVQKIVALSEIYGVEPTGRAIDDAHALGAYSCEYIANLLEQRQRLLPAPGALHLTHGGEALELELPPPDLSLYDQS